MHIEELGRNTHVPNQGTGDEMKLTMLHEGASIKWAQISASAGVFRVPG